jgi:hypothetical protein
MDSDTDQEMADIEPEMANEPKDEMDWEAWYGSPEVRDYRELADENCTLCEGKGIHLCIICKGTRKFDINPCNICNGTGQPRIYQTRGSRHCWKCGGRSLLGETATYYETKCEQCNELQGMVICKCIKGIVEALRDDTKMMEMEDDPGEGPSGEGKRKKGKPAGKARSQAIEAVRGRKK